MALTLFQQKVCLLLAEQRRQRGESYVAGGGALNLWTAASRISRDIDFFHDTDEALQATWDADRQALLADGYSIDIIRERPTYVEALIYLDADRVLAQWVRDSAFRFFPLIEHEELGLTLHPLDLATNKLLAVVGRLEVRDWVDIIQCHHTIQRLGYLAWAACGKDAGFSPLLLLEEAARSSHYTPGEIATLEFEGPTPDAVQLAQEWRTMLHEAQEIISLLPPAKAGQCLLDLQGELFQGAPEMIHAALQSKALRFHEGRIYGAWPELRSI